MTKKLKLDLDLDYNFDLIGICSTYSDYRLCWGINQALNLKLENVEDYCLEHKKEEEDKFSFFEYFNEQTEESFYLIKNQSNNYKRLIPEQDKIDYFLIIKDNYEIEIDDLVTQLRALDSVLTAFRFNVNELKSKSNLIF